MLAGEELEGEELEEEEVVVEVAIPERAEAVPVLENEHLYYRYR